MWRRSSVLLAIAGSARACTMIAAGKKATAEGMGAMVAHTDDAGGDASDIRLIRVPAADWEEGAQRPVYLPNAGYPRLVVNERGPDYMPVDGQQLMKPAGHIPQVRHTYAYWDHDYGIMNEKQLVVAETTCMARTVGWPLNHPDGIGYNLFGIAELSHVALERCESARCAIKVMGELAVTHGFFSEDSGDPKRPGYRDSSETLGIADKYGEVWVFHVMTGPKNASAVWAAQRVKDDEVVAVPNTFVIREMDLDDPDHFLASDNVISFAEENGWYDKDKDGPFDFTKAYSVDPNPADNTEAMQTLFSLYSGRRIWRIYDLVAPSLKLDSTLGFVNYAETYPFGVVPDEPVTMDKLRYILRDHYEGTVYDMTKGVAAGPYHDPNRWDGSGPAGGWERSISIFRTMYSFIALTHEDLPDEVGGVTYFSLGAPHGSVFVPVYGAQEKMPEPYKHGKQSLFSTDSAWRAFDFANNWRSLRWDAMTPDVEAKMEEYEGASVWEELHGLEQEAVEQLKDHDSSDKQALHNLYDWSFKHADRVVSGWWELAWHLVSKYSDGEMWTGEGLHQGRPLGYPADWLALTNYKGWPGNTYHPPAKPKAISKGALAPAPPAPGPAVRVHEAKQSERQEEADNAAKWDSMTAGVAGEGATSLLQQASVDNDGSGKFLLGALGLLSWTVLVVYATRHFPLLRKASGYVPVAAPAGAEREVSGGWIGEGGAYQRSGYESLP